MSYAQSSLYISLADAISHIAETDNDGDQVEALQDFACAARESSVATIGDCGNGHDKIPPKYWHLTRGRVEINNNKLMIIDYNGETRTWRSIEVLREDIFRIWPKHTENILRNSTELEAEEEIKRAKGPKPQKINNVISKMKLDIVSRKLTVDDLRTMTDKELVTNYGSEAGKTTCRAARDIVVKKPE